MAEVGKYYVTVMPNMSKFNSEISSQASSGGSKFGSLFSNSFAVAIGNVASNLFTNLVGGLGDIVQAGMDASDAMARFEQTMGFAGVTGAEFDAASAAAKAYADATVYNLDTVLNTTAQLASNGVADYESLMEAAGNLNAIAGGNAESFDSVALALTQVNGAGRLTTQDFNQLANAIPGASGQLQQALADMGAFDSETMNFRDAMAKGEISAEEFNAAIMNLGMSDAAQEAATSTDTFEGSIGNLQASVENLSMGIMGALAPALTDIINSFTSLVDEAAPHVEAFMAEAAPIVSELAASLMSALVPALEQAGSFVMQLAAEYGPPLMDMFSALMPAIQAVADVLGGVLGPVLQVVGSIVGETTSNTITAFTTVFNTITNGVAVVQNTFQLFSDGMSELWTIITTTVTNAGTAIINAVTGAWDTVTTTVSTFMETTKQRIVDGWEQAKARASEKLDALKSKVQEVWDSIRSKVTEKVDAIKDKISSGFQSAKDKVTEVFNTIKEKIINPIKEAKDKVTGFIDDISSAISGVKLELPSIRLPHFSVSGGSPPWGIGGMGSMPHFSVSWYATGGIVDKAMLFGAGEKGAELIWPSYSPYLERYADAIASRMDGRGTTYLNIDGSLVEVDSRLASLVGQVVDYAIGTYSMGRA